MWTSSLAVNVAGAAVVGRGVPVGGGPPGGSIGAPFWAAGFTEGGDGRSDIGDQNTCSGHAGVAVAGVATISTLFTAACVTMAVAEAGVTAAAPLPPRIPANGGRRNGSFTTADTTSPALTFRI